jgi:hypothetical protein
MLRVNGWPFNPSNLSTRAVSGNSDISMHTSLPWIHRLKSRTGVTAGTRSFHLYYPGIILLALVLAAGGSYYYRSIGGWYPDVANNLLLQRRVKSLWREGRVLVLLRHTEKCGKDDPCPGGQGLTLKGEQDARLIGSGMHKLFGGDFELFSSEADRTRATARLAFGRPPAIVPWLREDHCKDDLQARLLTPHSGNQIMVTHSTCLGILTDDQDEKLVPFKPAGTPEYGLAVFLERVPGGGMPRVLGYAWPEDWSSVLND